MSHLWTNHVTYRVMSHLFMSLVTYFTSRTHTLSPSFRLPMCLPWRSYMCDLTPSQVGHDSMCDMTLCGTWLMCYMCVWLNSSIHDLLDAAAVSAGVCDMTHSWVWHNPFICVTSPAARPPHCNSSSSLCVCHDSFICVTRLLPTWNMTRIVSIFSSLRHTALLEAL